MKGPMITQSLRGMANHGSMHWRGDRTGGNEPPNAACGASETEPEYIRSAQPDCGIFDEPTAFEKFNPAFTGLVGRHAESPPTRWRRSPGSRSRSSIHRIRSGASTTR